MSYDYAKQVLRDEALGISEHVIKQTNLGRCIDPQLLARRDEILAALAKLEEPMTTPNEQAAEITQLIRTLNASMCEQYQRHDYRSMMDIWTIIMEQVNKPKFDPETGEPIQPTPSLQAQYREALEKAAVDVLETVEWEYKKDRHGRSISFEINGEKAYIVPSDAIDKLSAALNLKNKEV